MPALPEKVLCINPKPLGNSVCMLSELRFLAEKHGQPVDVLIKNPSLIELYEGIDYIGQVLLIRNWRFWPWFLLRMLSLQKRMNYGHIYILDLPHARRFFRVFPFFRNFPHQIRLGFPEEVRKSRMRPGLMSPLALGPSIVVSSEQEREKVRQLLSGKFGWNNDPLVLFHPGCAHVVKGRHEANTGNPKQWPVENWRKTLSGIRELLPDAMFILTGTANERSLIEEIITGVTGKIASLAGTLSLRHLFALQSMAHSCISIDTGSAHTAMAVGCPTLILYGRHDPRYLEQCSPKGWGPGITIRGFRNREEIGSKGYVDPIKNIQPETVLRLWQKLPSRLSQTDMPSEHFVSHYCEGDTEPEVLPILF
jgi:heptosyltransferase-2/heptosyltransferase-3